MPRAPNKVKSTPAAVADVGTDAAPLNDNVVETTYADSSVAITADQFNNDDHAEAEEREDEQDERGEEGGGDDDDDNDDGDEEDGDFDFDE